MDGGSGLNILYIETYDVMGLLTMAIQPSGAPFHEVLPELHAIPLEQVDLPMTFGGRVNFRTKMLNFEVAEFPGAYHTILGRPCYAKFTIPNYTYLKLKIPGLHGIITVGRDLC